MISKTFGDLSETNPSWRVLLLLGRDLSLKFRKEPHFRLPTGGRALELPVLGVEAEEKLWRSWCIVCSLKLRGLTEK